MKRIKWLMLLLIIICLTGCGNTLKCEIKTNNFNANIKVIFKDDKPIKYIQKEEMIFNNHLDANTEIYYHTKYEEYSDLLSTKIAKLTNNNDKVTLHINYDFSKNSSDAEKKILISKNDNKKTAKEKIESSSYKCK